MRGKTRLGGTAILAAATMTALAALPGCHATHPDVQAAVYQALSQHDLGSVEVFEDRDHGTITLKGIVGSPDRKTRADQLVQQAAPGYTVQDHLTVANTGIAGMAKPNQQVPGGASSSTSSAAANAGQPAH